MTQVEKLAKRTLDVTSSALGLMLLTPLFLVIAAAIKAQSPGPVFYRGLRAGRGGRPFRIFKFRTMIAGADAIGSSSTPDDDSRITRFGGFLRKYKLDELPQLFNVLLGEMSLVGPRPQVLWALERYSAEDLEVLNVRPGITDWASLRFADEGEILRGAADPDTEYFEKIHAEKMRLALQYVRSSSFVGDLRILWQTFALLFGPRTVRSENDPLADTGANSTHRQ